MFQTLQVLLESKDPLILTNVIGLIIFIILWIFGERSIPKFIGVVLLLFNIGGILHSVLTDLAYHPTFVPFMAIFFVGDCLLFCSQDTKI